MRLSLPLSYCDSDKIPQENIQCGRIWIFKKRLGEIHELYPQIEFIEQNHDKDHIHLLVSISPKMSVGSVVRIIKSNTARDLKKVYPFLKKCYFGTESVWSDGYFVSTVGVNEAVIQRYIEHQGREDMGQAWLELK